MGLLREPSRSAKAEFVGGHGDPRLYRGAGMGMRWRRLVRNPAMTKNHEKAIQISGGLASNSLVDGDGRGRRLVARRLGIGSDSLAHTLNAAATGHLDEDFAHVSSSISRLGLPRRLLPAGELYCAAKGRTNSHLGSVIVLWQGP